ncbi:hypothetical protein Tco_0554392 [Tanacetum coccineum]
MGEGFNKILLDSPSHTYIISTINITTPKKQQLRKAKEKEQLRYLSLVDPTTNEADEVINEEKWSLEHSNIHYSDGEDSLKLERNNALWTTLHKEFFRAWRPTKTTQSSMKFDSLVKKVKKLEKEKIENRTHKLKRIVPDLTRASLATTASAAIITEVDITLAQALAELKSAKPKAITTLTTTAAITITAASTRPTAKGFAIDE